jgi:hypothetical protein
MRLATRARIAVVLLISILVLGPALSLASPMMNGGHDATPNMTPNMTMTSSGASSAQAECIGCADVDMSKAVMGGHCNIVCLSPVTLPAGLATAEQSGPLQWAAAPVEVRPGITASIDPYPPNLFS